MNLKSTLTIAAVAAAMVAASAAAALASPATAQYPANVRASLYNYAVVDTLHPGEWVNVQKCTQGFCYITHSGPDGWVKQSALSWNVYDNGYGDGYGDGYDWPHHHHHNYGGPGFCVGNWNGSFCVNP